MPGDPKALKLIMKPPQHVMVETQNAPVPCPKCNAATQKKTSPYLPFTPDTIKTVERPGGHARYSILQESRLSILRRPNTNRMVVQG